MQKLKLLALLILCTITTGCSNQYLIVDTENEVFHGAFLTRDFSHGDVQIQRVDGKVKCAGVLFVNEFKKTKDDEGKKYSNAVIKLSCDDERLIAGSLRAYTVTNWVGAAQDQFKKEYEFTVVSKKAYKNEFGKHKYTKKSYSNAIDELVKY